MTTKRLFKSISALIAVLTVAVTLTGCWGGPSDEVIKKAILWNEPEIKQGIIYNLVDYKITNQYDRDINGETVYTVDYSGNITPSDNLRPHITSDITPRSSIQGSVNMVRRGNDWYFLK